MAFIAVSPDDPKVRYAIREIDDPRQDLAGHEFVCQACGWQMYIKGGTDNVRFHFAHYPGYPTRCPYFAHERMGDSRHEAGKMAVMAYLRRFEQYSECTMLDEVFVTPRIADVMVTYPSGEREIHEVQLSAIQADELLERTKDYVKSGIKFVVWWLGGPMLEKSNISLMRDYFKKQEDGQTLIEFVDWPMLLGKRHLWPEEVQQLKHLGAAYGWSEIPMERMDLNGALVERHTLVFENGEYHGRNS